MTLLPVQPICLIGPPAAGKTTLAEALSRSIGAPVLRPRDIVSRALGRYPAIVGLFPRNTRGHVPDESLGFALRVCLDRLGGVAIFESLPWDAIQLADLYRVAGRRTVILHLHATDGLVVERRAGRRYCPSCYPQASMGTDGARCGRCGSTLVARPDDEQAAFYERLRLHRRNAARVLTLARDLRVDVVNLHAADPPHELASQALAIVSPADDRDDAA